MAKKYKFKPRKPTPIRGPKGRFVAKSSVKGKSTIKRFFGVVRESMLEVARNEVKGIAEFAADDIRRGIAYQNVPPMGGRKFGKSRRFDQPLHPFTVKQKDKNNRDPRTLISTGFYVRHIGVVEDKKGKGYTYRVGFTAKMHPGGITLVKLGRILEYGAKIKVTPKMRRYLAWKGMYLKKSTKYIVIPARPHWGPTLLKLRREMRRMAQWANKNITQELRKKLKASL